MRRLRIDLAYDGSSFVGFARQPDQHTVQGTLEGALTRVMAQDIATTCAGRTDRGVHATAQVVHCDVDEGIGERTAAILADLDALRQRLDRMAGEAVTVWRVAATTGDFDARFSARWRQYRYRMAVVPADPRTRGTAWHVEWPLDVAAMTAGLPAVVGEHDFASFCRRADGGHTVRAIETAEVASAGDQVHVVLRGTAFCHQQVRSIVGSLVEVGRGRRPPAWLAAVLTARDRQVAGPVAPPHGLTLEGVGYPRPHPDAPDR